MVALANEDICYEGMLTCPLAPSSLSLMSSWWTMQRAAEALVTRRVPTKASFDRSGARNFMLSSERASAAPVLATASASNPICSRYSCRTACI